MGYSSGKVSAPVSIYDIQNAVGTDNNDLGSLCKHTNINMWAKFKPVVRSNVLDTTNQWDSSNNRWMYEREISPRSDAWFRSDAGNYGITPKSYSIDTSDKRMIKALESLAADVKACTDRMNGWVYTKPSGTLSSPYRMLDFLKYYSSAPKPVTYFSGTDNVTGSNTSVWTYYAQMRGSAVNDIVDDIDTRDYIRITDVIPYGHIGIAIFRLVNDVYRAMAWATGNSWFGTGVKTSGSEEVNVGTNNVGAKFCNGGTYYALPVVFGESLPQTDSSGNALYGYSKQPRLVSGSSSDTWYVWSIPNTTFKSFTATWREMSNGIALPRVNPTEIGLSGNSGYFNGTVMIDSTVNGYNGSNGNSIVVRCALVTENWSGSLTNMSSDEYVSGSVVDWTGAVANNTVITIGNFSGANALIALPLQHSYRWAVSVDGEIKTIALRSPANQD